MGRNLLCSYGYQRLDYLSIIMGVLGMSITEYNKDYYHIPRQKASHKKISSEKLRSDVETWLAKDPENEIEVIEIGMSKFMSDIEKAKHRKKYERKGK